MSSVCRVGIFWDPESPSFVGEGVWAGYICSLHTTLDVCLVGCVLIEKGNKNVFNS